jgi:hypothetical protein
MAKGKVLRNNEILGIGGDIVGRDIISVGQATYTNSPHVKEAKPTTTLSIQKFGNVYAITGAHVDPAQPVGPVAPGGAVSIDEEFVKNKIISEFEALAQGEIDYEDLGAIMYNYFVPESIRDHLERRKPSNLVIMTLEHDIPWEFMNNGNNFWCTEYNMGRILIQDALERLPLVRLAENKLRIAVIVSDRDGNLPEAKKEGETIKESLYDDPDISVDLFLNNQVTKIKVLKILLRGKYDVIHYAGHADFNITEPTNSHLKLSDGSQPTYDEITRIRFDENARPVIFANACSTSKSSFVGDKLISLASAFARAGALAYIGTMWPIQDTTAADFATEFYKNLKHYPVGEALKFARSTIKTTTSTDAKGWVPYAYFGDPVRKIPFNNSKQMAEMK